MPVLASNPAPLSHGRVAERQCRRWLCTQQLQTARPACGAPTSLASSQLQRGSGAWRRRASAPCALVAACRCRCRPVPSTSRDPAAAAHSRLQRTRGWSGCRPEILGCDPQAPAPSSWRQAPGHSCRSPRQRVKHVRALVAGQASEQRSPFGLAALPGSRRTGGRRAVGATDS